MSRIAIRQTRFLHGIRSQVKLLLSLGLVDAKKSFERLPDQICQEVPDTIPQQRSCTVENSGHEPYSFQAQTSKGEASRKKS